MGKVDVPTVVVGCTMATGPCVAMNVSLTSFVAPGVTRTFVIDMSAATGITATPAIETCAPNAI